MPPGHHGHLRHAWWASDEDAGPDETPRTPSGEPLSVQVLRPLPGGVFVLQVAGDLDERSAPTLRDAVQQVPPTWPLLLDLRPVAHVDATGLGVLAATGMRRRSGGIAVVADRTVGEVLSRCGLARLLPSAPDVAAAARLLPHRSGVAERAQSAG